MPDPHGVGLYLELPTIFIAAFFGAAYFVVRKVTVVGLMGVALIVGLGGGIWRDIVLNIEPAAFEFWYFVPVAVAGGLLGLIVRDRFNSRRLTPYLRNLATALLLLIGLEKAYTFGNPVISVALIGILTAAGGTVTISLLMQNDLFHHNGGPYLIVCLLAASAVFLAIAPTGWLYVAEFATVVVFVGLRHLGHVRGWTVHELPWEGPTAPAHA